MTARIKHLSHQAKKFALWRAASALNWDCTLSEAAKACEMNKHTASYISRKYGWCDRWSDEARFAAMSKAGQMARYSEGGSVDTNAIDLTDLMR